MKLRLTSLLIALPLSMAALTLSGCTTSQPVSNVTMGQELQDLDQAYDDGALKKKEFKKAKKRIIKSDRYDRGLF